MDKSEFKDRLAVNLIPLFTQMMATVAPVAMKVQTLGGGKSDQTQAQLPDPQVVAAHVYNYCEMCALVREEHTKLLKQAKGQGALQRGRKPTAEMTFNKAGSNGGSKAEA